MTLPLKISLFSVMLIVGVLAATQIATDREFQQRTSEEVHRDLAVSQAVLEKALRDSGRGFLTDAQLVAELPLMKAALTGKDQQSILFAAVRAQEIIRSDSLTVVDSHARVVARAHDPERSGDSLADDQRVMELLLGKTFILFERRDGALQEIAGIPVVLGGTTLSVGAILLGKNVSDHFADQFVSTPGTSLALVVGDKVVARGGAADRRTLESLWEIHRGHLGACPNPKESSLWGKRYLSVCGVLPVASELGPSRYLQVISLEEQQRVLAGMRRARMKTAWAVGLIGLVVALVLSWEIARPIVKLTRGAERYGAGDFSYRLDIRSKDEVGELAREFDEMADKIQFYILQLEEAKADLEEAVGGRMREGKGAQERSKHAKEEEDGGRKKNSDRG